MRPFTPFSGTHGNDRGAVKSGGGLAGDLREVASAAQEGLLAMSVAVGLRVMTEMLKTS